ncbi:cell number regulator 8-like [Zingiber officinale]|uniref:PLAC8 family protein n=1 Tax=Zingiber officinale TaxID=94328 RepID=A0A8J5GHD3_ZINOF|nr:cell number regulator 8-like [Zingiber officinale]KAG6506562.1 hypothetical protein ZIOFF_031886 [Zingiber officinale]
MAKLEESDPLLKHIDGASQDPASPPVPQAEAQRAPPPAPQVTAPSVPTKGHAQWAAEALPVPHGSVIGEPVPRAQWSSGLFDCLGRNDEFCSSDLEVCLLGTFAPCVLYGSNMERLGEVPGSFAENCFPYTSLFLAGNCLFGWNCLAPWLSHRSRTAIRHRFNLEGEFEAFSKSCGGCNLLNEDKQRFETFEQVCDFATHLSCHVCSLCQEGRELRRRLPHPGFNLQPVIVMMPPMEQNMVRQE